MQIPKITSKSHFDLIKSIRDDIKETGKSWECPFWSGDYESCIICAKLFPKIKSYFCCPCVCYSSKYLIKRLNEILKENEKEKTFKESKINVDIPIII